ncbi:MAG: M4 family metallopeptidase [Ignavibacteria bacterium]|nr:M4 family metallopeptidase [Ignavibacteria bacterium]
MKKYILPLTFLLASILALNLFARNSVFHYLQQVKENRLKRLELAKDWKNSLSNITNFFKNHLRTYSSKSLDSADKIITVKPFELAKLDTNSSLYEVNLDYRVIYDPANNIPRYIFPELGNNLVFSKYHNFLLSNAFFIFIETNKDLFPLQEPKNELREVEVIKDIDKEFVVRYQQVYKGVPIWGKEILAYFSKSGELEFIALNIVPTPVDREIERKEIDKEKAIEIATKDLELKTHFVTLPSEIKGFFERNYPKAEEYYFYDSFSKKLFLSWMVELMPNFWEVYRYFISQSVGEVLEYYRANPSEGPTTGFGIDLFNVNRTLNIFESKGRYYLVDASKPMYNRDVNNPNGVIVVYTNQNNDLTQTSKPIVVSSTTKQFNNPTAVSLHYGLGLVYDYYLNTHSFNSINGNKKNIIGVVNVTQNGMPMINAYWNGEFMVFGDGGDIFLPFTRALDIIAHEFTHGVVQFTVDLEYKFQSGALHEAFADWGGSMVDREDWIIGEDAVYPQFYPKGTRNMANPNNNLPPNDQWWLPAHMNEYRNLPLNVDNGGVHINVGIINKVTYLIGDRIGRDKLEKIYFRVLSKRFLTKQANFVDFRIACEKSAEELYGKNSPEQNAVKMAFDAVGITSIGGSSPSPDLPPIVGNRYILAVDAQANYLYRLKEILQSQSDIVRISSLPLFTASGSTYTITEDGSIIAYIDFQNKLRVITTSNWVDQEVNQYPVFRSIAVSGGKKPTLAIATIEFKPEIILVDVETDEVRTINLYTPTTTHGNERIQPLFPVNLTWSPDGKILVYDAINMRLGSFGDTTYFADINALDVESGIIYRLMSNPPEGINIASPMFSQTNNQKLAFVVYDENSQMGGIFIGDMYSGKVSQILVKYLLSEQVATPVFAPDDRALVFQSFLPSDLRYVLYKQALNPDKFTPYGQANLYVANVGMPRWVALGGTRSSVETSSDEKPVFISPNPFSDIAEIYGTFYSDEISVVVYSHKGEKLFSQLVYPLNGRLSIDFPKTLPTGIYIFEIKDGNNFLVAKAIRIRD